MSGNPLWSRHRNALSALNFFCAMNTSLVVLTDFSAVANRALTYAAELALPLDANLVLLHVRYDPLLGSPDEGGSHFARRQHQKTERALVMLAADQSVPTTVDVADGVLSEAVKETVRRHHPLLLVLARAGLNASDAKMATRTAMDLLRYAPHPLLVVPDASPATAPPCRLLLAVDGEPFHVHAYQHVLRRLLAASVATLEVVHVTAEQDYRPSEEAVLKTVRANNLVDALPEATLHDVYHATAVGGVLKEAARQGADLLVVVARRRSFFGRLFHRSVTAQLLEQSPIPVLVLPAEEE